MSTSTSRVPQKGGVGTGTSVRAPERTVSSSEGLRLVADLRDELLTRLALDELVHYPEPLEGVLAVEDAGLVDVVRLGPSRVQDAPAEVAVDRRSAHEHGVLEPLLVQLAHARGHLLRGRDEQRAKPDGRGVVLLGRVDDRPDRHLLAEVDDRVPVVSEDGVDERLADVMYVAEHGRQHDRALRVALDAVEVVLELRDRALHDLG
jgi:hypothetical protein